jgi:hypothetical protein
VHRATGTGPYCRKESSRLRLLLELSLNKEDINRETLDTIRCCGVAPGAVDLPGIAGRCRRLEQSVQ